MRLPSKQQIDRIFGRLMLYGIDPKACRIDITSEGISISPPSESKDAFDEWEKQDNERRSRHTKAA